MKTVNAILLKTSGGNTIVRIGAGQGWLTEPTLCWMAKPQTQRGIPSSSISHSLCCLAGDWSMSNFGSSTTWRDKWTTSGPFFWWHHIAKSSRSHLQCGLHRAQGRPQVVHDGWWSRTELWKTRQRQHIPCCHLCMGGSRGIEWEDFSEDPIWARTILTVTPFDPQNPSPFRRIPGCHLSIENITCYFYLAEHVSMLRKRNIFSCTLQITQIRSLSGSHVQDRRLPHLKGWVPPRLLWSSHLLSQQPGILWRRQFPIMSSGCPLQF